MPELSPMMQQYMRIKAQNEDSILFFRVGDFYEMFFEDAKTASEELDIVLTGKDCGLSERAPMCGVPYHSCEAYIARLVAKGYKVAICEQTEDPATAKGLVNRDIIRTITPGTVIEDTMLEEGKNNYLAAIVPDKSGAGICFADASTGECYATVIPSINKEENIISEISAFKPSEILIFKDDLKGLKGLKSYFELYYDGVLTYRERTSFNTDITEDLVLKHFGVNSMENLGVESGSPLSASIGAVMEYIYEMGVSGKTSVKKLEIYTSNQYMKLDMTAVRNLEILETMRTKSKKGSLLWVLDKTRTAMGKRYLRSCLTKPLMNITEINDRQNAVEELSSDTVLRGEISESLVGIRDIERIMTKIVYGTASAKDLNSIADTAEKFPAIKNLLSNSKCRVLKEIYSSVDTMEDVTSLVRSAIADNPPATVREGKLIRKGYNSELDLLNGDITDGNSILTEIEARERERTGIKTLKVKYNKVFGYYIEVTNSFLDMIPEDYIRKQTLTGAERFVTEELKQLENRILSAKDRSVQLEYELFCEVRNTVAAQITRFQKTASAIAELDMLCSLANVSVDNGYTRPLVNNSGIINIKSGRHPVVEQVIKTPFVTNDTFLNMKDDRCAIITGPNMAGKSTYMRQVAIITLMAQMGCFVPAEYAEIGLVDAIFTRVGAADDLASGQSTFMVEMSEVADILKNATKNSLLILDEIGRGTSTFDGMSIARAVLEHVTDRKKLGAKALFATHYHELTDLENEISGVRNYNISVKKRGDDIIFLRRIVRGPADDSYGIEVASLSGIPKSVTDRAKEILKKTLADGVVTYKSGSDSNMQLSLETAEAEEILKELQAIDVNTLTPIESMQLLFNICDKAKSV